MINDARKLSTEEQHLIRKLAVQRVFDGESAADVTRSFGLGKTTIFTWLKIAREKGIEALCPKVRTGRNRKLSDLEEQEIKHWIIGGDPRQHGFDFGLWTRQIVADLVLEKFGVELSPSGVGKILYRLGLTPQKPLRRAYERDEEAVQGWVDEVYPKVKKYAKKSVQRYFGWMKRLYVQMILSSELGARKVKHLLLKRVVKDSQSTQFLLSRIKVVFGIRYLKGDLTPINV